MITTSTGSEPSSAGEHTTDSASAKLPSSRGTGQFSAPPALSILASVSVASAHPVSAMRSGARPSSAQRLRAVPYACVTCVASDVRSRSCIVPSHPSSIATRTPAAPPSDHGAASASLTRLRRSRAARREDVTSYRLALSSGSSASPSRAATASARRSAAAARATSRRRPRVARRASSRAASRAARRAALAEVTACPCPPSAPVASTAPAATPCLNATMPSMRSTCV